MALGLPIVTANPDATGKLWLRKGALVFCSEDDRHSLTASTSRYRTPPHLIIIKSMGIFRTISARPWSDKESQTRSPAITPRQNQNALLAPPSNVVATIAGSDPQGSQKDYKISRVQHSLFLR